MTACRFRSIPQPPADYDETSDEVWYPVAANDVFPEEFATFLLTDPDVRTDFQRVNADLLDPLWWQRMQRQIGELPPEVLSYPASLRFAHECAERPSQTSAPVKALEPPPR
jgi:isocitrate dehydrogenase kinase/phosphatase